MMAFSLRMNIFTAGMGKSAVSSLIKMQNRMIHGGIRGHQLLTNRSSQISSLKFPQNTEHLFWIRNIVAATPHGLNHGHRIHPFTNRVLLRGIHSTFRENQQHKENELVNNKDNGQKMTFGDQMSLRLINENGFLSWTRNSYLSAAVGATMLNGANLDLVQQAGVLVMLISAMNMIWGSGCHFSNLIRIRDRSLMSRPTLFLNLLGTVVHALLWLFILGYYFHFSGYKDGERNHHFKHRHHHAEK